MKKVLFTANLDSFFIKFLIPQLKYFKDHGYEVHVASKNQGIDIPYCDKKLDVCFTRSLNLKDIIGSYKKIKSILLENDYELISCHTPFGAAIPRLAVSRIKNFHSKIVYTAHGFHFYKGAPLINWMLYYPMEKYLSKYTTSIITINDEDYSFAKKKMKSKVYKVHGIGISKEKFDIKMTTEGKKALKKEVNITNKDFVMIFPGEINNNKNQILLLNTVKILKERIPNLVLLLPGYDLLNGELQEYAKNNNIEDNVRFLGYRKDIPQLLRISNIAVSSSKREGLPINIIESMYVGLPIVATNCRGNRDLIKDGKNGYLVDTYGAEEFADKIYKIYKNKNKADEFIKFNKKEVNKYMLDSVLKEIIRIYER
ncbi:MAG: glycosyltransferase family 4 protein [Bacilli bacterium]